MVLGGGVVGTHAIFIALGMGAEVWVLDRNTELLLPAPFDLSAITDAALEAQHMTEKARILAHEQRSGA